MLFICTYAGPQSYTPRLMPLQPIPTYDRFLISLLLIGWCFVAARCRITGGGSAPCRWCRPAIRSTWPASTRRSSRSSGTTEPWLSQPAGSRWVRDSTQRYGAGTQHKGTELGLNIKVWSWDSTQRYGAGTQNEGTEMGLSTKVRRWD